MLKSDSLLDFLLIVSSVFVQNYKSIFILTWEKQKEVISFVVLHVSLKSNGFQ